MADEPLAPEPQQAQDTPSPEATPDTSQETPETPEQQTEQVDFEKRYQDLQPEYTRATQEAAQYRQIIELAQQGDPEALALLGIEVEQQDTENEDQDPDQPLTRAEFEQFQQAQQQERQAAESEQAFNDDLWQAVEAIEEKEGREITDAEASILRDVAVAQVVRNGTFDLEPTWDSIKTQDKAAVERYVNSKKQALSAPLGSAGEQQFDLSTEEGRREAMAHVAEGHLSAED